jgi:predicted DNA-binding protein
MGKRPLSPDGSRSDTIATRLPRVDRARLDALLERRGQTHGQFIRDAVLTALADAEQREVDAKAS